MTKLRKLIILSDKKGYIWHGEPMKTSEAVEFFKTQEALAKALGISQAAVSQWGETVPKGRAYQLQVMTRGKLKAEHQRSSKAA